MNNTLSNCDDHIPRIVLGSRSPRRRDLLGSIVGPERLVILPPSSPNEPGFTSLHDDDAIEQRLKLIVQLKHADVCRQLTEKTRLPVSPFVVVADTIVVASDAHGQRTVLGQPCPERWQDDVRDWFRNQLSHATHDVWTALRLSHDSAEITFIVRSQVTFCSINDELLEWYISTGESQGKAGGYAIQGYAAAFVTQVNGSLTNVIGLPVLEALQGLTMLGWKKSGGKMSE
jgi:septum formation protein